MTPFDLLFILSFLGTAAGLVRVGYLWVRKRTAAAKTTAARLATFAGIYAITLVAVSLASPGKELAVGDTRCFDEWCITVTAVSRQPNIGDARATGIFYVVTVRISSRSRGRRQRETGVCTYLTDSRGRRFDVSPMGQAALQRAGVSGEPVTSFVDPGGSFDSRLAFDLPQDTVGVGFLKTGCGWLPNLIIGDPGSFLHRPTIVRLGTP